MTNLTIESAIDKIVEIGRYSSAFDLRTNSEIREIGETINKEYGFSGMVQVCESAGSSLGGSALRMIEKNWSGIGNWRG